MEHYQTYVTLIGYKVMQHKLHNYEQRQFKVVENRDYHI
jgi:hypothetical protein